MHGSFATCWILQRVFEGCEWGGAKSGCGSRMIFWWALVSGVSLCHLLFYISLYLIINDIKIAIYDRYDSMFCLFWVVYDILWGRLAQKARSDETGCRSCFFWKTVTWYPWFEGSHPASSSIHLCLWGLHFPLLGSSGLCLFRDSSCGWAAGKSHWESATCLTEVLISLWMMVGECQNCEWTEFRFLHCNIASHVNTTIKIWGCMGLMQFFIWLAHEI